jgi:hypothetical protein
MGGGGGGGRKGEGLVALACISELCYDIIVYYTITFVVRETLQAINISIAHSAIVSRPAFRGIGKPAI